MVPVVPLELVGEGKLELSLAAVFGSMSLNRNTRCRGFGAHHLPQLAT
jgi:hypothetical protein